MSSARQFEPFRNLSAAVSRYLEKIFKQEICSLLGAFWPNCLEGFHLSVAVAFELFIESAKTLRRPGETRQTEDHKLREGDNFGFSSLPG